jgi:hypothetical protein
MAYPCERDALLCKVVPAGRVENTQRSVGQDKAALPQSNGMSEKDDRSTNNGIRGEH